MVFTTDGESGTVNEAIQKWFSGDLLRDGTPSHVLSIFGSPRSGKTTLCYDTFVSPANAQRVREGSSFLIVSHRLKADELSNAAVIAVGNSVVSRPVKTLAALAFDILKTDREAQGLTLPKLLDGAEQDQLIRGVLSTHLRHVQLGDDPDCATCGLLKRYFSVSQDSRSSGENREGSASSERIPQTTEQIFTQMMTPSFAMQLRDMFARLSELHFPIDSHEALTSYEAGLDAQSRQCLEWEVAAALRSEYAAAIEHKYPDEFRVDNAFVLVAAESSIAHLEQVPQVVIVDDSQDLTLAGFSFLQTLAHRGTMLLLAGNDDESVQTFRGAYPEVLSALQLDPDGMNAVRVELPVRLLNDGIAQNYLAAVAARVSAAVGSVMINDVPIPLRPAKLIASNAGECAPDDTLRARLFRSGAEELDDLVWQVKSRHLQGKSLWNDYAVIAHDNATLQTIGKRFEEENIPVTYSSVARPLKEESVVQGLLALLKLMECIENVSSEGAAAVTPEMVTDLKTSLDRVVRSPLFCVEVEGMGERSIRMKRVMAALSSLAVLEGIAAGEVSEEANVSFAQVRAAWQRLSIAEEPGQGVGFDGLLRVLILGSTEEREDLFGLLNSILARGSVRSAQPDIAALKRLIDAAHTANERVHQNEHSGIYLALWCAWDACGVARSWQERALCNSVDGRAANRLLDTVIRLFTHAASAEDDETITAFIDRISGLEIEADSLAKIAPSEDAVTLTTPAGASGFVKEYVWIPSLQQDVWPNLTPRNTLFGAEVLADTVLASRLEKFKGAQGRDGGKESVRSVLLDSGRQRFSTLYSEMKSFLVALTRGTRQVCVSAVLTDTAAPSEFLYAFMPELFTMKSASVASVDGFTQVGGSSLVVAAAAKEQEPTGSGEGAFAQTHGGEVARGGLDSTARGIVSIARARLAKYFEVTGARSDLGSVEASTAQLPQEVADAARTLSYLARNGVKEADPDAWSFLDESAQSAGTEKNAEKTENGEHDFATEVTLSPSSVDRIWQCPLRWALENKYNGPRSGNSATGFGTLIHNCAEEATLLKLDQTAKREELLGHMLAYFKKQRAEQVGPDVVRDRYAVAQQDRKAEMVLGNIATYFVESRNAFYGIDTQGKPPTNELPPAGELTDAEAETSFRARFSLSDIAAMAQKAMGDTPDQGMTEKTAAATNRVFEAELSAALTALADGFDADFSQHAVITLSGRIDRLEHRQRKGQKLLNIVDYKTGRGHGGKGHSNAEIFSDLQLVCYQLGLMFSSDVREERIAERSVLFDVEVSDAPAVAYRAIEGSYQPALFDSSGALSSQYQPRPSLSKIGSLFKQTDTYAQAFAAFPRLEEAAVGNEQLMWCLSMISRVFYAAGYRQAHQFVPKRGPSCNTCLFKGVCPAWPEESRTVYGATHGGTLKRPGESGAESQVGEEEA